MAEQIAIEVKRQTGNDLQAIRNSLNGLHHCSGSGSTSEPLGRDVQNLNEYIRSGGYFKFDTADTNLLNRARDYGRTVYAMILLGTKFRPEFEVNPGLVQKDESKRDALKRLSREQMSFVDELPERPLEESHLESLSPAECRHLQDQFHRLARRVLILNSFMDLYILNENYYLDH